MDIQSFLLVAKLNNITHADAAEQLNFTQPAVTAQNPNTRRTLWGERYWEEALYY